MTESERFQAVYESILRRDTRYDGIYYVGIATTGIVCRPSCRSRIPKPENVRVYDSLEAALRAGFRPCKRCKPDTPGQNGPDAQLAQAALKLIQHQYAEPLTLAVMASRLNISPFHLQRTFKRTTGRTPAEQLMQTRLETARRKLTQSNHPVADIARAVGFRSASHFTAVFHRTYGCSPQTYRAQGGLS
ncbi:bifunctional transcriptional activator/DNA repair enzyme AdaA [Paenibacillus sp. HJGM_3]|uniref:bifunctional transcriptional activator/DNA repair enzyme AdaA n=1 Tax=Paenibacillus sp. HJGM_3 TaxID=3379816 RepID=UPI00385920B2